MIFMSNSPINVMSCYLPSSLLGRSVGALYMYEVRLIPRPHPLTRRNGLVNFTDSVA